MLLRIENYNLGEKVVSLALDKDVFEQLYENNVEVMYLCDNKLVFEPDGIEISISQYNKQVLLQCDNYDVFTIGPDGKAFLYYNNKSTDNAIMLTSKCNSNCVMCPTAAIMRKTENCISPDMTMEVIKHIPNDAAHLTITGGEPFMIKGKIFDVFKLLKEKFENTKFLLLTNGRAMSYKPYLEKFIETAPNDLILGIPLHGYNQETHDKIVCSKGAFEQTVRGLKNLLYYNFSVELRIVVSKLNYKYIKKIAGLIVKEFSNVSSVKIMGLEMLGNAAVNCSEVWIPYKKAFDAMKDAIDILILNQIDVGLYNFPLCAVEKKYHLLCAKSITDYKVRYVKACDKCKLKDACGGIFAGTVRIAGTDVKPWR